MRIGLVIVAALLVSACSGITSAQQERLSAAQAVINERIKAGTMTEAEGRLSIAQIKAEVDGERRRNAAIVMSGKGVYQPVGGGTVIRY